MNTLNKILIAFVVLLVVVLGFFVYTQRDLFEKPYYAVYLSTGDLYFGQLSGNHLNNVIFIRQTGENEGQGVGIGEFREAFWGPEGGIILNPAQVVWRAKIGKESQIIEFIKNGIPQSAQMPQGAQMPLPQGFGADPAPPIITPEQ